MASSDLLLMFLACCITFFVAVQSIKLPLPAAGIRTNNNASSIVVAEDDEFTFTNAAASYVRFDDVWPITNSSNDHFGVRFQFKTQQQSQLLMLITTTATANRGGSVLSATNTGIRRQAHAIVIQLVNTRLVVGHVWGDAFDETTNKLGLGLNDDKYHSVAVRLSPKSGLLSVSLDDGDERDELVLQAYTRMGAALQRSDTLHVAFVGGLSSAKSNNFGDLNSLQHHHHYRHFVGCMANIEFLSTSSALLSRLSRPMPTELFDVTRGGCRDFCTAQNHDEKTATFACKHGARCINKYSHALCDCSRVPFEGAACDEREQLTVALSGADYVSHLIGDDESHLSGAHEISLTFRTRYTNVALFYINGVVQSAGVFAAVDKTGHVTVEVRYGTSSGGEANSKKQDVVSYIFAGQLVNDQKWHRLRLVHAGHDVYMQLDATKPAQKHSVSGELEPYLRLENRLFIGKSFREFDNFVGCLRQAYFNGQQILRHILYEHHHLTDRQRQKVASVHHSNYHAGIYAATSGERKSGDEALLLLNWRVKSQCAEEDGGELPVAFYSDDSHATVVQEQTSTSTDEVEWQLLLAPKLRQYRVVTLQNMLPSSSPLLVVLDGFNSSLIWSIVEDGASAQREQHRVVWHMDQPLSVASGQWVKVRVSVQEGIIKFFFNKNNIGEFNISAYHYQQNAAPSKNVVVTFGQFAAAQQRSFAGFLKAITFYTNDNSSFDTGRRTATVDARRLVLDRTSSTRYIVNAHENDFLNACRDDANNPCKYGACSTDGLRLQCACNDAVDQNDDEKDSSFSAAAGPLCSHASVRTSCTDYFNYGASKINRQPNNGQFQRIKLGHAFVTVNCTKNDDDDERIYTTISHNLRPRQLVRSPTFNKGGVKFELQYAGGVDRAQLSQLIAHSDQCRQNVEYECTGTGTGGASIALGVNTFFHTTGGTISASRPAYKQRRLFEEIVTSLGTDQPDQCACASDGTCPFNFTSGTMLACNCDDDTLPSGAVAVDRGTNSAKRVGAVVELYMFDPPPPTNALDKGLTDDDANNNNIEDDMANAIRSSRATLSVAGEARMTVGPLVCWQEETDADTASFFTESSSLTLPTLTIDHGLSFAFKTTAARALLYVQPPRRGATLASLSLALVSPNTIRLEVFLGGTARSVEHHQPLFAPLNRAEWIHVGVEFSELDVRLTVNGSSVFLLWRPHGPALGPFVGPSFLAGIGKRNHNNMATLTGVQQPGFVGCIKSLRGFNDNNNNSQRRRVVPIGELVGEQGGRWPEMSRGCQSACAQTAKTAPCLHGGRCRDDQHQMFRAARCECRNEFAHTGERCEHDANANAIQIGSAGDYLVLNNNNVDQLAIFSGSLTLSFRTHQRDTTLVFAYDAFNNLFHLYIDARGRLVLMFNDAERLHRIDSGKGRRVDDGDWHQIHVARKFPDNIGDFVVELLVADSDATPASRQISTIKMNRFSLRTRLSGGDAIQNFKEEFRPLFRPTSLAGGVSSAEPTAKPFVRVYIGDVDRREFEPTTSTTQRGFIGCLRGLKLGAGTTIDLQNKRHHRSGMLRVPNNIVNGCAAPCDEHEHNAAAALCSFGGKCRNQWETEQNSKSKQQEPFECDCTFTARNGEQCDGPEQTVALNGSTIVVALFDEEDENSRTRRSAVETNDDEDEVEQIESPIILRFAFNAENQLRTLDDSGRRREIVLAAIVFNNLQGWLVLTITPQNFLKIRLSFARAFQHQAFETFTELDARQSHAIVVSISQPRGTRITLNINGNAEARAVAHPFYPQYYSGETATKTTSPIIGVTSLSIGGLGDPKWRAEFEAQFVEPPTNLSGCVANAFLSTLSRAKNEFNLLEAARRGDEKVEVFGANKNEHFSSIFDQCSVLANLLSTALSPTSSIPDTLSSLGGEEIYILNNNQQQQQNFRWAEPISITKIEGMRLQAGGNGVANNSAIGQGAADDSSGWSVIGTILAVIVILLVTALCIYGFVAAARRRKDARDENSSSSYKNSKKHVYEVSSTTARSQHQHKNGAAKTNGIETTSDGSGGEAAPEFVRLFKEPYTRSSAAESQPLNANNNAAEDEEEFDNVITVAVNGSSGKSAAVKNGHAKKPTVVRVAHTKNGGSGHLPRFRIWPSLAHRNTTTDQQQACTTTTTALIVIDDNNNNNNTAAGKHEQSNNNKKLGPINIQQQGPNNNSNNSSQIATCYNLAQQAKAFLLRKQHTPTEEDEGPVPVVVIRKKQNNKNNDEQQKILTDSFSPRITLYIDEDSGGQNSNESAIINTAAVEVHASSTQQQHIEAESPSSSSSSSQSATESSTVTQPTSTAASSPGSSKDQTTTTPTGSMSGSSNISLSGYTLNNMPKPMEKLAFIDYNGGGGVVDQNTVHLRSVEKNEKNRDSWFTAREYNTAVNPLNNNNGSSAAEGGSSDDYDSLVLMINGDEGLFTQAKTSSPSSMQREAVRCSLSTLQ